MVAAVGFIVFLAIALVGSRGVPPRLRTIWPVISGCLALVIVTLWKVVT